MHRIHRTLGCAALCAGMYLSAGRAVAEDLFPPAARQPAPTAAGRSATQAARGELAAARAALLHARLEAEQLAQSIDADLRNGFAYRDLQRSAAQASARYYAVRRPIVYGLRRDADFLRLEQARDVARSNIRQLVNQQKTQYTQLLPYARQAMDAGRRMSRAESIALALEPTVEDARTSMTEAYARLRLATQANRDALIDHPGLAMAREEVASAKQRVNDANRRLAAALTAEAAAERGPTTR